MKVIYTNSLDKRFISLSQELDNFLLERMGNEKQEKCYCSNIICSKDIVVLFIEDEKAIACGSVRKYSKSCAEIKRIYVKKEYRNKGYGKCMVETLENIARKENFHFMLLETGNKLKEAYQIYKELGYKVIPNYAEYKCAEDSLCMKKNIISKQIQTERLILRHVRISDVNDIFEYSKNPDVGPNAGWEPHKNIDESKKLAKNLFIGQNNIFGIVLKDNNKLIGTIGLINDPKRENPKALMLGYALSKDYWGKGIMSEASKAIIEYGFTNLALDMITCCCYTFNKRSRRVIEKNRFKYEGIIRGAEMRYDGKIFDFDSFSLTRDEWKNE